MGVYYDMPFFCLLMQAVFLWKMISIEDLGIKKIFQRYIWITIVYTMIAAAWALCYKDVFGIGAAGLKMVSTIFLIYEAVTRFVWFRFSIWSQGYTLKGVGRKLIYSGPIVLAVVLSIANIWTEVLWSVPKNTSGFQYGKAFAWFVAVEYSYFVVLAICAFLKSMIISDKKGKRRQRMFLIFSVLPLLLAIAQIETKMLPSVAGTYLSIMMTLYLYIQLHEYEKINLNQAITRAEISDRQKSVLISNISHDIRTPLTGILGYANLASKCIANEERTLDYLEKITDIGKEMDFLINSILDMNLIEAGEFKLNEQPENLVEIVLQTKSMLQSQMRAKKIQLYIDTSELKNIYVYCDRNCLERCLLNVIGNAVRHSSLKAKIVLKIVQLHSDDEALERYEFHIVDNGMGVENKDVQHMFERGTAGTFTDQKRRGLGLDIVKNFVELMGGNISAQSIVGKGTEFVLSIPFRSMGEMTWEKTQRADIVRDYLRGKRILLVDDNTYNLEILKELLSMEEMCVETANDAKLGMDILLKEQKKGFDAVLLDVQMPGMDGYEMAKIIRQMKGEVSKTPIILMTATTRNTDTEADCNTAINGYIKKPYELYEIKRVLYRNVR